MTAWLWAARSARWTPGRQVELPAELRGIRSSLVSGAELGLSGGSWPKASRSRFCSFPAHARRSIAEKSIGATGFEPAI